MDEQESSKKREPLSAMEEERPSKVQKNEDLTAPEEIDNRVIEYLYGMEEELLLKKMNFEQRMGIDDTLSIYRAKIVDVLALLSCRLGLDQDTLHTEFSYYDRYNSLNPVVDTDKLELIGVSSLYIAGFNFDTRWCGSNKSQVGVGKSYYKACTKKLESFHHKPYRKFALRVSASELEKLGAILKLVIKSTRSIS